MNACLKAWIGVCMTASALLPVCAHAQTSSASETLTTSQTAQATPPAPNQSGNWQPYASSGETRAQVYQDLVHAEQDGQIKYLDRTIYAHH
ncbi:hypothetical protein BTO02_22705 [Paraburkholderia sp. SOS3]|jgi:hypothetical protein|nr:hypothetical protein BTO02_22705 [Paraburkholderia sp. SOS3]